MKARDEKRVVVHRHRSDREADRRQFNNEIRAARYRFVQTDKEMRAHCLDKDGKPLAKMEVLPTVLVFVSQIGGSFIDGDYQRCNVFMRDFVTLMNDVLPKLAAKVQQQTKGETKPNEHAATSLTVSSTPVQERSGLEGSAPDNSRSE